MNDTPQDTPPVRTAGPGHWPKVILMGLTVGLLCGLFPILVLTLLSHTIIAP